MSADNAPWLVVGLGNPGPEYARNRHNVGFMVADLLADRLRARFGRHRKAVAEVAEGRLGLGVDAPRLVLAKPLTYMNRSGGPVAGLAQFYKVPVDRIVAMHDDLDLPYGRLRMKVGGGEGGHNGLRSMSRSLGTKEYIRVRFGIGRPPGRQDPADYVLADFSTVERKELEFLVDRTAGTVAFAVRFNDVTRYNRGYLMLSALLPLAFIVSLAANRAYEKRYLYVGTDEYQRVLRAGLSMTAALAVGAYAFELPLARGYVVVALPLTTLACVLARFAVRHRLHR